MEYKINYKGYEFNITQNEDGTFNIPEGIRDIEPFGTAIKPAVEPICVARKPLSEKTVALNVLKWGTGGINIDGCRVGYDTIPTIHNPKITGKMGQSHGEQKGYIEGENTSHEGRFPANIILECICDEVIKGEKGEVKSIIGKVKNNGEVYGGGKGKNTSDYISYCISDDKGDIHTDPMCPCRLLDEQSGVSKSSKSNKQYDNELYDDIINVGGGQRSPESTYSDKGGASRFFYQAKVSKKERNMGLATDTKNIHPTVKPVNLMAYLCRLITPPGGTILDPYMGSGSTGIAALLEGFNFIGMDLDPEYVKIAEVRISNYENYREFLRN